MWLRTDSEWMAANRNLFRARNPVLGSWKSRTLPGHGEEMDLRSFFFDKIFGG
jgi:hypothetical protein